MVRGSARWSDPEIVTPGSPEYERARQEWNRRIQRYPLGIAYCHDAQDVSEAVVRALDEGLDIRVRSGGHNYEGYSVGDGVVVIDVSRMNGVWVDEDRGRIAVGGGAQNHDIYGALAATGRPFPGGTCPTVGVSGFALGGGWGLSCRLFGLGCDNLLGLELIDYRGRRLRADRKNNPDLFWACRGAGGGNFGVVTGMTFKLPPAMGDVTYFRIKYPNTSLGVMREFIEAWQELLIDLDNKMGMQASAYNDEVEGLGIFARGIFYGTPAEASLLLRPLASLPGAQTAFDYLTFAEAMALIGSGYPNHQSFKSTGRFAQRELGPSDIRDVVDIVRERPEGSMYVGLGLYALGGAVSKVGRHDTAFYYRDARYILLVQSIWEDPAYTRDNVRWVDENFPIIEAVTDGSYVNFPFSGLRHYQEAYYGGNAEALSCVKAEYDPCGAFRFPQSLA